MAEAHTLAVIGAGNMGGAFVRRVVRVGAVAAAQIVIADADSARAKALADETGVRLAKDNAEAATAAEYILVVVKPGVVPSVLKDIASVLRAEQTVVSFAAGVTLGKMRGALGELAPALVRVMPNTPALVGEGISAVAAPGVARERVTKLVGVLEAAGQVVEVEEKLMDAVTGLSGSGPAFVFVLIEALADGGVAAGLPRPIAHQLAVQTVAGAAKLVQETGQHPGALKDAVASPGGTTIAGLAELERGGFRGLVATAVRASAARARELSREE
jgi:pyrroline-5-carboxylate reductase